MGQSHLAAILACLLTCKVAGTWRLVVPGAAAGGGPGLSIVLLSAFALGCYQQHLDLGDSCCRQLNGCEQEYCVYVCRVSGVCVSCAGTVSISGGGDSCHSKR